MGHKKRIREHLGYIAHGGQRLQPGAELPKMQAEPTIPPRGPAGTSKAAPIPIELTLADPDLMSSPEGDIKGLTELKKAAQDKIDIYTGAVPIGLVADITEYCINCGKPVMVQVYRGRGLCCLICDKAVNGEPPASNMLATKLREKLNNIDKEALSISSQKYDIQFANTILLITADLRTLIS